MSTHIAIAGELHRAAAAGQSIVLATVVRVVGSSYGGVGTRMVIHVDGSTVGLVSGGCLESDLCEHAINVHSTRRARVVSYDTRADDDAVWGLGLGCNGLIEVLLDPLDPARARAAADLLDAALAGDEPAVIATLVGGDDFAPHVGAQALFVGGRVTAVGDWPAACTPADVSAHVSEAAAAGRRGLACEVGGALIAFEVVRPAVRLVICGAGPDAAPVARMAVALGWDVTVVDHRRIGPAHATRYAGARTAECAEPEALADAVPLSARTAAVVMSHHFARDTSYVQSLLAAGVAYVGVLGPRARTERMLAELAARGIAMPRPADNIFGPVGLDLGGDGPEAIALAIVAEVAAVTSGRAGTHLRDEPAALHRETASHR